MDYIERMEQEYIELTGRVEKLYKAIKTLEGLTADELGLMYAQYYSMKNYEEVLSRRISLAKELGKINVLKWINSISYVGIEKVYIDLDMSLKGLILLQ